MVPKWITYIRQFISSVSHSVQQYVAILEIEGCNFVESKVLQNTA